MTEPRLVAGVDSSTQATKVVVCDAATGRMVREGRAPHPLRTLAGERRLRGWVVAHPSAVGAAALAAVPPPVPSSGLRQPTRRVAPPECGW